MSERIDYLFAALDSRIVFGEAPGDALMGAVRDYAEVFFSQSATYGVQQISVPPAAELLAWLHGLLSPLAKWTPTSIDDQLVRFIEALQKSEDLLRWIDEIVLTLGGGDSLAFSTIPFPEAELRRAAAMAGVDWGQVVMVLLPLLTELLRRAIEYFSKPATPTNPPIDPTPAPASDYKPRTKPRCN